MQGMGWARGGGVWEGSTMNESDAPNNNSERQECQYFSVTHEELPSECSSHRTDLVIMLSSILRIGTVVARLCFVLLCFVNLT